MKWESRYAERARGMKASEIRELLKLTQQPDIISFAGGLPSPDSFPTIDIAEVTTHVMLTAAEEALQYGTTEGYHRLREYCVYRSKREGIDASIDNVVIVSGSQQGIDVTSKILLNKDDQVIVEAPSYLGGLGAMKAYQPQFIPVKMDGDGLIIDELEETLKKMEKPPKLIYTVPTFQNPAGVTLTEKRRKRLIDLAHDYDFVIMEDNPYGELRYSGDPVRAIKAFDDEGRVIYLSTFSKIFSPGMRLAWVIGDEPYIQKFIIAKQGTDLCTNSFVQRILYEYCRRDLIDGHITKIIGIYRKKRDIMLEALEEYFPEGCSWTKPDGGLFLWARVPEYINTKNMIAEAIKQRVAYVQGAAFFVDGSGTNTMRLCFSYASNEKIREGIKRLGRVIKKEIEAH
ncbi:MAG: PLP-dependent aminotransferase family protein [Theionarchaea archaeon]|nr:MAG: aminotransferase [Theionarchaea archaeon DG-70]MBU7012798.1 PLP-dependent aminotransferase family protein [Theionarchaea archaeon]